MPLYPSTDRTMLERIIAGEEISWNEFYQRYAPVVRALCRIHHLQDDQTDDVVQEVMRRFSDRCGTFLYAPERARFRTYFNRIVRGAIADCFRKQKHDSGSAAAAAVLASEAAVPPEIEQQEQEVWKQAVLDSALQELAHRVSSQNYLAFTMSAVQGHSIAETAAFLHISAAQVYLARTRCSALLRKIVRRCADADPEIQLPSRGY